jgi:hypothetical protein
MLDAGYRTRLKKTLDSLPCHVNVPDDWNASRDSSRFPVGVMNDERGFARAPCQTRALMELGQTLPAIVRTNQVHVILMNDISRRGVGLLHHVCLYPGEKFSLWLVTGKRLCTVTRCLRLKEGCFKIGAEFVGDSKDRD